MEFYKNDEDLEYLLRPTKKNRKIFIGLYCFLSAAILFINYIQLDVTTYADDIKDYSFTQPYKWTRICSMLRIGLIILGALGILLNSTIYWKLATLVVVAILVFSLLIDMLCFAFQPDNYLIAMLCLLYFLELLCYAFFLMLLIVFSYQYYVSQRNNNLQLVDPDAKLMHDLFNSMVRIVPGFGFFLKKTSETTKSE